MKFGEWIIFADESGDHGLESIDSDYPVFVLVFVLVKKVDYANIVCPKLQELKFKYFGHDAIVFHEREIRKSEGHFGILFDPKIREVFFKDLGGFVGGLPVTIFSCSILKRNLKARYASPDNPYHLGLRFGLERLGRFLAAAGIGTDTTHVVVERRGRREDQELELEFRRIMDGWTLSAFDLVFADKKANAAGMQIADLMARPIGRHVLDPRKSNRAFDALKPKLFQEGGKLHGAGLKVFP